MNGNGVVEVSFDPDPYTGEPLHARWEDGVFCGHPIVVDAAETACEQGVLVPLTPFGPTVKSGADDALSALAAIVSYNPGRQRVERVPPHVASALAEPIVNSVLPVQ
jgi:hypothetical protein